MDSLQIGAAAALGIKKGARMPPVISTQTHGREERNGGNTPYSVHVNEPIEVLLKYTIACFSVLRKNSIQARLGSNGLITTIKKTDVSLTNVGNMIAVQVYLRLTSFGVKGTVVLSFCQSTLLEMAAFISRSILRMMGWRC